MEKGQFSAAVAAIKEIGILSGIRIERFERGAPGEFENVSNEQLLSELRDMGLDVRMPSTDADAQESDTMQHAATISSEIN